MGAYWRLQFHGDSQSSNFLRSVPPASSRTSITISVSLVPSLSGRTAYLIDNDIVHVYHLGPRNAGSSVRDQFLKSWTDFHFRKT